MWLKYYFLKSPHPPQEFNPVMRADSRARGLFAKFSARVRNPE
jgi:hypothetical protein